MRWVQTLMDVALPPVMGNLTHPGDVNGTRKERRKVTHPKTVMLLQDPCYTSLIWIISMDLI